MLVGLVLVPLLAIALWRLSRARYPYPPGPTADPFIGHLRILLTDQLFEKFHDLAQIYGKCCSTAWTPTFADCHTLGDVIHLWTPGRNIIILNSDKAATDLMHSRGAKYSSRPYVAAFDW